MHLVQSLLVVAWATPLALAGSRENVLHRRTGDDNKQQAPSSSALLMPVGPTPPATMSSSIQPASFAYGTGGISASGSTEEILTTDIVYTTLTTCPVTSTVTSGTQAFEEVTITISTVTRTSTSTICTMCVAPPTSKAETSPASVGVIATSTLSSSIVYSLTQPSAGLLHASSKPELPGSAVTAPSRGLGFPSVASLTVSATLTNFASVGLIGYAIVPSPTNTLGDKGPFSNATSSITPVFPPSLLGNGYGGGFASTPSVYVTKLPFPIGPSEGLPPGYGFSSQPGTFARASSPQPSGTSTENSISLSTGLGLPPSTAFTDFTGLGLPSSTAFNVGNVTYEVSIPAATASLLSSVVPILNASVFPVRTYTSQIAVSGSSSSASAMIVAGSGFGFAVMGPQGSSSDSTGVEGSTATGSTVSATGSRGESLLPTLVNGMPIGMSANGAPIFASSSVAAAAVIAASQVTGAPNPEIAPTASTPTMGVSEASSEFLSNVPAIPITHTASSGQVIVETSNPPPVFISSIALGFELIITTSTPSPVLVSQVASSGQIFVATSTPPGVFINSASGNVTSLVVGSPFAIGVVGSPTSYAGQVPGASITLAATPSPEGQGLASVHSAATALTPVVGSIGLASLAVAASSAAQNASANQPVATILTPVVGANGLTSLAVVPTPVAQTPSANQPAATMLTAVVGFNGLTSFAVIPSPVVGANGLTSLAVFSTPVVAANGLASPAVILTPVVGANGVTSLAVLATPVVGANGLTSLAVGLQGLQGSSGTPSPIEATIPAPITPTLPIFGPGPLLGSLFPSVYSARSTQSGSNSSVHVPLNPSTVMQLEGSAIKLSLSIGMGLLSFIAFVLFL